MVPMRKWFIFNTFYFWYFKNYTLCNKYCIPPLATAVIDKTIIPAVSTPIMIGGIAFLGGKFKKLAIREPTQAPVPGSGIATNRNSPSETAFCNFLFS